MKDSHPHKDQAALETLIDSIGFMASSLVGLQGHVDLDLYLFNSKRAIEMLFCVGYARDIGISWLPVTFSCIILWLIWISIWPGLL